ncbi:winged helix-turn-helix transcriptional regulator [Phragmitibacter flavus]|uniref:Winged helix-turn-helix transcriptional regulator n=1 Tax=Phragmitibacter flavus TaxID=2576071 RepID=A0A5R8KA15_9BACT|nr:metalloregulator ArsR/SmtB family transcription factor [Phragmitibacter flavus]TLD69107.1 winged helix-turn-helix transcriptional regulator [Phragmitibacter flavus]
MVEYDSELLDRTFAALADPTRRQILAQLANGDECVTDLARSHAHAMSLAAVSKHLGVLEKAGLVKRERLGRVHSLALGAKPMQEALGWVDRYRRFWEANLDQFEDYLETLKNQKTNEKPETPDELDHQK